MKRSALFVCLMALAVGQSSTSTYATDINGRRTETRSSEVVDGSRTERLQSINGRQIPVEQASEKVLSESASGRTVERIVKKFDQTGNLTGTERTVSEEVKLAGGGSTVKETVYRSDLNGFMKEAERRVTETRVAGATSTAETTVARPSLNGTLETAEKRTVVTQDGGAQKQISESIQRPGNGGRFTEAVKRVTTVSEQGSQKSTNTAVYEPGMNGQLELASQSVEVARKQADGSEVAEVNLYARSAYGRAQEKGAAQQIKEQQIIERRKAPDGSQIETVVVRRPSVADPNRLGNPQPVSETVCRGKCQ